MICNQNIIIKIYIQIITIIVYILSITITVYTCDPPYNKNILTHILYSRWGQKETITNVRHYCFYSTGGGKTERKIENRYVFWSAPNKKLMRQLKSFECSCITLYPGKEYI